MPRVDPTIAAYERKDDEEVRAQIVDYKRQKYFSFRVWYATPEGHEPARNGINLPVSEYHEFRRLVAEMDRELGYVPETEEV